MKFVLRVAIIFSAFACGNSYKVPNAENLRLPPPDTNDHITVTDDTIPYAAVDKLDTESSNVHIYGTKEKHFINLFYTLSGKQHTIHFRYADYSDVVFPDTAIGIVGPSSYKTGKIFIWQDSILFLPIIGINNLLSTYIVNLNTEQILGDDIRTALPLLWIDEKTGDFITAEAEAVLDTVYQYTFIRTKLRGESLKEVQKQQLKFKQDIRERRQLQLKLAKQIFKHE